MYLYNQLPEVWSTFIYYVHLLQRSLLSEYWNFYFPKVLCSGKSVWKEKFADFAVFNAGKSLSEALIFASINPQYDNRLFM